MALEIVACLRTSGPTGGSLEGLAGLDRRGWERTLTWLDQSDLALWLWGRFRELGIENILPPEIRARLARNLADHALRVVDMEGEFNSINRCLEEARVLYAVLKGFALIPEYCPNAAWRNTYDYDYLLAPECLERAQQALRAAGYVRKKVGEDNAFVYFHSARPPRTPESRDDLYSPSFNRTVELRDHVWNANQERVPFALPQGFLDRASPRTWGSLRFCSLSAEDQLLVQVLHAFRHILHNWCRLSWLLEIAYFLEQRSQDSAFWEQFCKRIQAHRPLPQIAGVVFSLAADLFGAAIPPSLSNVTIQTLPTSLTIWVSRYGLKSALDNFSGNKFSLFLHREFIQDDAAWRELRRSRLFPLKWPNHAARACDPRFSSRLAAGWKQGLYVAHRLLHHLTAAARYGWESVRWERVRLRGW